MPVGTVPRYKVIKCRTCGKIIFKFDRSKYPGYHVPMEVIMSKTRQHYKISHPRKFKTSIEKGVRTRMGLPVKNLSAKNLPMKNLLCPLCQKPNLVSKANVFLKCSGCGARLRSVKVRK